MSPGALVLEVVALDGHSLRESGVDVVVVHRAERGFEVGSEVAVFPGHAPMLVRIPISPARYGRGGRIVHLALGGGFLEVKADRVVVLAQRFEVIPVDEPEPSIAAGRAARAWRAA